MSPYFLKSVVNKGWVNLKAFSGKSPVNSLRIGAKLDELSPGIPDDAYVHLSPANQSSLENGINPTYWVKWGDVKSLTILQYKNGVVGPGAPGNLPNAQTFAVVLPGSSGYNCIVPKPCANVLGTPEFYNTAVVNADNFIIMPPTN